MQGPYKKKIHCISKWTTRILNLYYSFYNKNDLEINLEK